MSTIKVCTRYRSQEDATFDTFPYHQSVLHHAVGEYTELPGWSEDISAARSARELPAAARDYLRFISDFIGVPGRAGRRRPRPRADHLDRRAARGARRLTTAGGHHAG